MADSKRKQVIDAFVTAVDGISSVRTAQTLFKAWWDLKPHEFDCVIVRDGETEISEIAFPSTSEIDQEAMVRIECIGIVHDMNPENVAKKRTDLISNIESTILSSTGIGAVTDAVYAREIDTDDEQLESFGIFSFGFDVRYFYNHLSP